MALIKCSECGDKVSTKAAACPHCGAPVEGSSAPAAINCSECGAQVSAKVATCPHCGAPAGALVSPATKPKKKGLFGFLSGNHPVGSKQNPIMINTNNPAIAVTLEYKWIGDKYGPEGIAWRQVSRTWETHWGKELYRMRIKFDESSPPPQHTANETIDIWFDVTALAG